MQRVFSASITLAFSAAFAPAAVFEYTVPATTSKTGHPHPSSTELDFYGIYVYPYGICVRKVRSIR